MLNRVLISSCLMILTIVPSISGATEVGNGKAILEGKASSELASFNDPGWERQWNLKQQYYDYIYPRLNKNTPIKIAVIDSSIDHSIPDFHGTIFYKGFTDYSMEFGKPNLSHYLDKKRGITSCIEQDGKMHPVCEHGTQTASIIAANTNNRSGIVGIVPNVEIIESGIILAPSSIGKSSIHLTTLENAIERSIDLGARVINMSLSQESDSNNMDRILKKAEDNGVVVVASAGNQGRKGVSYPAKKPTVIAVGAYERDGITADYSSIGPEVDIAAPGSWVPVSFPGGGVTQRSGTSIAAPMVSATAALMIQQNPKITPAEVRERIYSTASNKPKGGKNDEIGHGHLNMAGALGIEIPEHIRNKDKEPPAIPPQPSAPPVPGPTLSPIPSPSPYEPIVTNPRNRITRLAGRDRIETAIEISRSLTNRRDEPFVVLARADDFSDTIAAGPLAKIHNAPLLITNSDELHPLVKDRIQEVQAKNGRVIIVGGTKAISTKIENSIRAMGRSIIRIAGSDRIDTSIKIAEYIGRNRGYSNVSYSDGWNYQTSVLAGNLATRSNGVQVLLNTKVKDQRVREFVTRNSTKRQAFVGRKSTDVSYLGLASYQDDDATLLSIKMNSSTGCFDKPVGLATADSFPDGFAGGAHIGVYEGCLYLVYAKSRDPQAAGAHLDSYLRGGPLRGGASVVVYGGRNAFPDEVVEELIHK